MIELIGSLGFYLNISIWGENFVVLFFVVLYVCINGVIWDF